MSMNQQEKTKFILDITENLRNALLERVHKMPESWDGVEIRQLISDLVTAKYNYHRMSPARKRHYNNTVLNKNLD
jgi:hypothetical protein